MEITRRLHLTLADQARDRYPRIPFDLPEDATSFEVQITVEKAGHGAGIDLGCEGPDGFRGWSGGARKSFVITREDATPGYLPGRLVGGTWYVVLGIHTLPAEGSDVGIRVISPAEHVPDHGPVEDPAPRETRGSERGLPAPAGLAELQRTLRIIRQITQRTIMISVLRTIMTSRLQRTITTNRLQRTITISRRLLKIRTFSTIPALETSSTIPVPEISTSILAILTE